MGAELDPGGADYTLVQTFNASARWRMQWPGETGQWCGDGRFIFIFSSGGGSVSGLLVLDCLGVVFSIEARYNAERLSKHSVPYVSCQ